MSACLLICRGVLALVWLVIVATASQITSIAAENKRPGTTQWWKSRFDGKPVAQGYSTAFSYKPGDTVSLKISTAKFAHEKYTLSMYRLGYYNGTGARQLDTLTVSTGTPQPACFVEKASRTTDCSNWRVSAQWTIPADSVSGIYIAVPTQIIHNHTYYGAYIPFVVRQAPNKVGSDLLFKTADMTWVAYNKYGGWNVYDGDSTPSAGSRAHKASYNRPWQNRHYYPHGMSINFVFGAEFPMLYWLEKQGYDVSYCSCQDIEDMHRDSVLVPSADSHRPPPYKVLLSVGHDEYWTQEMKNAFEHARENGVHLAFFSGNEMFWRVVWEENSFSAHNGYKEIANLAHRNRQGNETFHALGRPGRPLRSEREAGLLGKGARNPQHAARGSQVQRATVRPLLWDNSTQQTIVIDPRRVLICRKETLDNVASASPPDWTGTFRDPRHRPPQDESLLTGQQFMVNGIRHDAFKVTREDATLRFWRDTSFYQAGKRNNKGKPTDVVYWSQNEILGYEWDAFPTESRPAGLFPLSTTTVDISAQLVQDYGTSYDGSGNVTHRLTMYRHYSHRSPPLPAPRATAAMLDDACAAALPSADSKSNAEPSKLVTSLVFGAGTVQWSWALSDWHDGEAVLEDRDLQQATLNLFADMGVFPSTLTQLAPLFVSTQLPRESEPLGFPRASTDMMPPKSSITSIELDSTPLTHYFFSPQGLVPGPSKASEGKSKQYNAGKVDAKRRVLQVSGTVVDVGGNVAAVEVSLDGGRTWHMATGRKHWTFTHHFLAHHRVDSISKTLQKTEQKVSSLDRYREQLFRENVLYGDTIGRNNTMLIMSRAVDDSGWIEQVDELYVLCQARIGVPKVVSKKLSDKKQREKHIVARNAILVKL